MKPYRITWFSAAAVSCVLLIAAINAPKVLAAGSDVPSPNPPPSTQQDSTAPKKPKESKTKKKDDQKSENDFIDGYRAARTLILAGRYEAGIAAMHALGHDDNADVANYIGYADRKLGKYDESKLWYEKALAANPEHTRTWQYYGLWYLEQGNRLKAIDHLEKIRSICGTGCEDYVSLQQAIDGKISY